MSQEAQWDREYRESTFLTKENKPQLDVVRFVRFLKKDQKIDIEGLNVIDLGSGTGRNSFYFAELGCIVDGIEISKTAVDIARKYSRENNLNIDYFNDSFGEKFPFKDNSYDIALDVTSSNSLSETEREVYLAETHRVLKTGGYFFVKALCKDADANAKHLLKHSPGPEKDTYILPEVGIVEHVWSREDFIKTYEKYFTILHLEKKTSYTKMNNRSYKRNFWICYMKK